ncbi:hypothetical protein RJ639_020865 [Escallonia herrerae]|uniref:MATH domain-containing protein n=1 Tax=Escallonia herrerae TaxID=1293975 RepID=A0AA88V4B2_9ASTE|nr:hypothetical protein RJ639_020865 [Escallonia herrerae]
MARFVISTREAPPAHYSLKVEPFSLFLDSKNDKYESGVFEGAGSKWKLCFYPNGQLRNGGAKYISLGLEIADADVLPFGWQVIVHCKMFVFDQNAVNYTVFEEANSNPRTFYGMNREYVFKELMTVEALMDDTKGYIVNDSCIFGVEIAVPKFAIRGESLLLTKDPENNIFTWRISSLKHADRENFSDEFEIGGHNWMLSMYPRGDQKVEKNYLSLFLCLANTQSLPLGRKVYLEYKLRIKNQLGFQHYEKAGHECVYPKVTKLGFSEFIQLGEVYDESKGFLFNGSVIIEGEITVMSSFNYLE